MGLELASVTALTRTGAWQPERLPEESDEQHGAFLRWVSMRPRPQPGTLPAPFPAWSGAHRWVERAQAYDSHAVIAGLTPLQQARLAAQSLTQALAIGAERLLRAVAESPAAPTAQELRAIRDVLGDVGVAESPRARYDWSRATAEELRRYSEAGAFIRALRARCLVTPEEQEQ